MEFEQIYELYFKDVFLYLRSLSATAQTAEEIAQEAFVKAWKSIESYDGTKDIRAWLFTIAKNTYYTHCRREKFYADYKKRFFICIQILGKPIFSPSLKKEKKNLLFTLEKQRKCKKSIMENLICRRKIMKQHGRIRRRSG